MTIDVTTDRKGGGIVQIQTALKNTEPAMKAIAQLLEAEVEQAFNSESSPWGTPWPALSPTTLKLKARGGLKGGGLKQTKAMLAGNKMLQGSGALFGGIVASHTKRTATVKATGTAAPYAGVHQFGNPRNTMPGGALAPIPARPFFPIRPGGRVDIPDAVMEDIRDILRRHLERERND